MGIEKDKAQVEKDGTPGDNFARGMELQARQTVFAEGCTMTSTSFQDHFSHMHQRYTASAAV